MTTTTNTHLDDQRQWLATAGDLSDESWFVPIERIVSRLAIGAADLDAYRDAAHAHAVIAEHEMFVTVDEVDAAAEFLSTMHQLIDRMAWAFAGDAGCDRDATCAGHFRSAFDILLGVDELANRVAAARQTQAWKAERS